MTLVAVLLAGCLGAAIGSFLNVVIWRLPRGESVVAPRSSCPQCATPIRARDNVPVLSWALLRGRCRDCKAAISPRYPVIEALTALLCVAVVVVLGPGTQAWLALALVLLLVPVTFIDLDHRIIPNVLMAIGAVSALALVAVLQPDALVEHLIAAAGAGGFLLVAAIAYPAGMGMGDVKLAAVLGLFLGTAVAPAMFVAMLAGSVVGALIIARKGAKEGRKTAIPFGPYLAFGAVVGALYGDAMVDWYLRTFV
jgi:leader peptidase (prepilin peptidase) / N-methyltransferase